LKDPEKRRFYQVHQFRKKNGVRLFWQVGDNRNYRRPLPLPYLLLWWLISLTLLTPSITWEIENQEA